MFVTLEGPEGAGKTTLQHALADRIRQTGRTVLETREPGAGDFGKAIREIVLHGGDLPAESELFLFLADRANHVQRIIKPALSRGEVVLCDRYADSALVYQAYARGLDEGFVRQANHFATQGLVPDRTLLLDVSPEVGLGRLTNKDRIDAQPVEFHRLVREGFLKEAVREPRRWVVIDANQPQSEMLDAAWRCLQALLVPT